MSNALAFAAVSAVLKDRLDNAFVDASLNALLGSPVRVTTVAPHLLGADDAPGAQLNLYLYRVSANNGWRNASLPSRASNGGRLTNPPLAVDLHYLLSAYGSEDFEAEILLGYAMQQFHEHPILTREAIRTTLAAPSPVNGIILPPAFAALAAADLADQVELIKLSPETLGIEELSKLWSAFQTNYRPSAAYVASVVLIEAREPTMSALPVLTVGLGNTGPTVLPGMIPPYPTIDRIALPNDTPGAYLGDPLRITGHHLAGDPGSPHTLELTHAREPTPIVLPIASGGVRDGEITATLAPDPTTTAAGVYAAAIALTQGGIVRRTNSVPLVIAPRIDSISAATAGTRTTLTVQTTPVVFPGQPVSLIVGSREVVADPRDEATATLTFRLEGAAPGTHAVRLRVDGVESRLVDRSVSPPAFTASQVVTL